MQDLKTHKIIMFEYLLFGNVFNLQYICKKITINYKITKQHQHI